LDQLTLFIETPVHHFIVNIHWSKRGQKRGLPLTPGNFLHESTAGLTPFT